MLKRRGPVIFVLFTLSLSLTSARTEKQRPPSGPGSEKAQESRLHIISSSHQDIAWMNSPEACIEYRDTHCITPALEMMRKSPDYCFVMENMLNLMEYLERHPERREEILRFTREGRLEWGATFNQPYESLLSGEQLVRQTYFGRKWLKTHFPGCDALVYFNPDVPGRALQMQQILSKAGIPFMVISRYHEGFYRWSSPDGSSVIAYSPGHYTNASAILGATPAGGVKALDEKLAEWRPARSERRIPLEFPLLHSVDFSQPTDFGPLIELWNGRNRLADGSPAPIMQYSSARRFFEALIRPGPDFADIRGERPNLWLYIHGPTHHWAITAQREAGVLLPAAEIFSAIASLLDGDFGNYPAGPLSDAWQAAVYPDHGWGGKEGQLTDRLFRKKYEFARDQGKQMLTRAVQAIASNIKTGSGEGIPVVVFNSLSWERSSPVDVIIDSALRQWLVLDTGRQVMPSQVSLPRPGQKLGTTRLEFIAKNVPPLGYKTFYVIEDRDAPPFPVRTILPSTRFENAHYKVEFAPGGVKQIFDKELGCDLLNTDKFLGFEVFSMRSVGNGAGEFGRVQQPTMEGFDKLSLHGTQWEFDPLQSGPLRAVFRLKQKLESCTVEERVSIYNHLKRIDCQVAILNWDGTPYREFRLALPIDAPQGEVAYEVPMGIVEVGRSEIPGTGGHAYGNLNYDETCSLIRPREVQNFLSAGGPHFGVTLNTSVAVNDYLDPTPDSVPYPVLQPVLLASRRSCHGEGNWYLQEGDHRYRFSLYSHPAGWRNGYHAGIETNCPLFPVTAPQALGNAGLPEEMSFFSVSVPNVLVSTVKKCEDDESVIIRLVELEGKDSEVGLSVSFLMAGAERVNMIEEEGNPVESEAHGLKLKIGHHAIETMKLRLKPGRP
jgi:alpha-mannosidase